MRELFLRDVANTVFIVGIFFTFILINFFIARVVSKEVNDEKIESYMFYLSMITLFIFPIIYSKFHSILKDKILKIPLLIIKLIVIPIIAIIVLKIILWDIWGMYYLYNVFGTPEVMNNIIVNSGRALDHIIPDIDKNLPSRKFWGIKSEYTLE